jgi:hypothetical protein
MARVFEQILLGVSTRGYAGSLEASLSPGPLGGAPRRERERLNQAQGVRSAEVLRRPRQGGRVQRPRRPSPLRDGAGAGTAENALYV